MRVVRDGETQPEPHPVDPLGVVLVTVFLVTAGGFAQWGGWWWFLAIPLMARGVVGMVEEIKGTSSRGGKR